MKCNSIIQYAAESLGLVKTIRKNKYGTFIIWTQPKHINNKLSK